MHVLPEIIPVVHIPQFGKYYIEYIKTRLNIWSKALLFTKICKQEEKRRHTQQGFSSPLLLVASNSTLLHIFMQNKYAELA